MKNIAMLFPGQGAQYVGMAQQLLANDAQSRQLFAEASEVLSQDMTALCSTAGAEQLNQTQFTQPALVLCGVAAYRRFVRDTGLTPVVMAGHSIGEITALIAANALSLADGLRLAQARGAAMAALSAPGEMGMTAVVKLSRDKVEQICQAQPGFGETFVIANYNSAAQLVLSGTVSALASVEPVLKAAGANCITLRVSGAFHSPFMQQAAAQVAPLFHDVPFAQPKIPVIANVNARLYQQAADIAPSLLAQISAPVLWQDSIERLAGGEFNADLPLAGAGIDLYLDMGPGVVLKKLTQVLLPAAPAFALDHAEDQAPLARALEVDIRNRRYQPAFVGKCMAVAVATRNQNFDEAAYQQGVLQPYQQLKSLHDSLQASQQSADLSQMRQALQWLAQIMTTKAASPSEQQQRLHEIVRVTGTEHLLTELAVAWPQR